MQNLTDWYLTDHLDSVRDVVSPAGTVLNHREYDSFGNILSQTNAAQGDRFAFTGRELDSATGLYYYRARYYDPVTGRFLAQDPIKFAAGDANLYRYVGNSPTNAVDPTGLESGKVVLDAAKDIEEQWRNEKRRSRELLEAAFNAAKQQNHPTYLIEPAIANDVMIRDSKSGQSSYWMGTIYIDKESYLRLEAHRKRLELQDSKYNPWDQSNLYNELWHACLDREGKRLARWRKEVDSSTQWNWWMRSRTADEAASEMIAAQIRESERRNYEFMYNHESYGKDLTPSHVEEGMFRPEDGANNPMSESMFDFVIDVIHGRI